jgi:hypothetical protein
MSAQLCWATTPLALALFFTGFSYSYQSVSEDSLRPIRSATDYFSDIAKKRQNLQGTYTAITKDASGKTIYHEIITVKKNESSKLVIIEDGLSGYKFAYGYTYNYCYLLVHSKRNKKASSSDEGWVISSFEMKANQLAESNVILKKIRGYADPDKALYTIQGEDLLSACSHPAVTSTTFEPATATYVVTYKRPDDLNKGAKEVRCNSGQVRLRSEQGAWYVNSHQSTIITNTPVVVETKNEANVSDGIAIPLSCSSIMRFQDASGKQSEMRSSITYSVAVPAKLPSDSEFMLSQFGLPEPFKPKKAFNWSLTLLVLASAMVLCGLFLRRFYTSRSKGSLPA